MNNQVEGEAANIRESLFQKQVCVPATWTDEEIEAFANRIPCGTTKGWTIEEGSIGSPKYAQCTKFASHVHVLLNA